MRSDFSQHGRIVHQVAAVGGGQNPKPPDAVLLSRRARIELYLTAQTKETTMTQRMMLGTLLVTLGMTT